MGGLVLLAAMGLSRVSVRPVSLLPVGLVVYGTYQLLRGILRVLGGRAEGSLTEMD